MFFGLDQRVSICNLRKKSPLVQCITNDVAMNFCANVLNALGASPVMAFAPEEASDFVEVADALTANIGTLTQEKYAGMRLAMARAKELNKTVVFDPVAHFSTPFRRTASRSLLKIGPSIIRGNASEIIAFTDGTKAKGVDSRDENEHCFKAAIELSKRTKAIVAISGETDFITNGDSHWLVKGGHPLMAKVSATGCALTCVTGAFASLAPDKLLDTTIAAFVTFSAAGALAGDHAKGPGSFVPYFLDTLSTVDEQSIAKAIVLEPWKKKL